MIRFTGKWVRKINQEPVAAVRITHYLTREELAHLLVTAVKPHFQQELRELSKAEMEEHIRDQLKLNPDAASWWSDDYREDEYGEQEVSIDEALKWARRQVAKFLVKKLPQGI